MQFLTMKIKLHSINKQWIMKKYEKDHVFNNGTTYKIMYTYNLENSS